MACFDINANADSIRQYFGVDMMRAELTAYLLLGLRFSVAVDAVIKGQGSQQLLQLLCCGIL